MDTITARAAKWADKIRSQGPWDENDALPTPRALPMPTEVAAPESFRPLFTHLHENGSHEDGEDGSKGAEPFYGTEMLEFNRGVIYADGRMDLCKMGTGPTNIQSLMRVLEKNTHTKHFLLGNNIIGPVGAKAIGNFINHHPDRFETWYLAGNCIDADGFSVLVDAMVHSNAITNVWLKRNPLGSTAAHDLFRLITQTPNLRTLDLDQTELGDAAIADLFRLLAQLDQPVALRHVYLNGTGLGSAACEQISRYLATPNCRLQSLCASTNPIGDAAAALTPGIKANRTLQHLALGSCGLKDDGTIDLLGALVDHPSLKVLDLGQAYSTQDLGMRYNWLTDACVDAVVNIVSSTKLRYLDLFYTPMTQNALNRIFRAILGSDSQHPYSSGCEYPSQAARKQGLQPVGQSILDASVRRNNDSMGEDGSDSLLWLRALPLVKGGKSVQEVKAGQESVRLSKLIKARLAENVKRQYGGIEYEEFEAKHRRFVVSPPEIRYIDSVYRTCDMGMARRGIKVLDKHWEEGDETLERVARGEV